LRPILKIRTKNAINCHSSYYEKCYSFTACRARQIDVATIFIEANPSGGSGCTSQSIHQFTPHTFTLAPYCVKMFRQRWYVIGMSSDHPDEVRVYALDRVKRLILTEDRYKMPRGFNAKACFRDYYGIYNGPEKPERIVLRVTARGANYLRTLPLHTSQREKEKTDEYSVFEYRVAPTKDLIRELQAYGTELQVLEPQSLVEQFRVLAKEYARMYTMNDNINIEQV